MLCCVCLFYFEIYIFESIYNYVPLKEIWFLK